MKAMMRHIALACVVLASAVALANADGGTVQASSIVGTQRITIFTSPSPLRVGPVDVSVLVQDAASGMPLPEARVELEWSSPERPDRVLRAGATQAAATNKLLRAAIFDLPHAGSWKLTAKVSAGERRGELSTQVTVGQPLPKWRAMWPWYCWPALVVVLFVWRQLS